VVNATIVTKLQFIRIKPELVYIGGRRTASFDENVTPVNRNCKYSASNNGGGNSDTKRGDSFRRTV